MTLQELIERGIHAVISKSSDIAAEKVEPAEIDGLVMGLADLERELHATLNGWFEQRAAELLSDQPMHRAADAGQVLVSGAQG